MDKKIGIGVLIAIILIGIIGGSIYLITNKETKEPEKNKETYSLLYKGKEIKVGEEFKENSIEEEYEQSEVTNCAFAAADKVYTYDDLEIVVATIEEKSLIYSVYFITDEPETKEGIKLGDSLEKMLETYGKEYEQPLTNKYIYTKENVELSFIIENENITSIEYTLIVE